MSRLRPIAEPFVVAPPSGARTPRVRESEHLGTLLDDVPSTRGGSPTMSPRTICSELIERTRLSATG